MKLVVANAVFTTKPLPGYDDTPEVRYHFPRRYLKVAEQSVGDWIVYYEPRRLDTSEGSRGGRQSYFAIARVTRIVPDLERSDHYYAYIASFVELVKPVSFMLNGSALESGLRKPDASLSMGAFRNAVRLIERSEFDLICDLGLTKPLQSDDLMDADLHVAEDPVPFGTQRGIDLVSRKIRDRAFATVVRRAYNKTCAMTGLQLVNGGGRCEIEAAHIKAVEDSGPDSPRNGLALCRTVHWMFDRGILSLDDDGTILMARSLVPEQVRRMLNPSGQILMPADRTCAPHKAFLRHHRETRFRG
jgi:putative restriction endonuclease